MPAAKKGKSKESANGEVVEMHSKELKHLIKDDENFLAKLKKFATMPDAEFGNYGQPIVGKMISHTQKAMGHVEACRKLFNDNKPFFYEMKQRLLNPKYRPDLNPDGRSPEDNLKNFGAKDWADYREKFVAYSLKQADRLLKDYEKETDKMLQVEPHEDPLGTTTNLDPETGLNVVSVSDETGEPKTLTLEELAEQVNANPDPKGKSKTKGQVEHNRALADAYKADQYNHMLGLLLNAPKDITREELLSTLQATAQKEYEGLSAEDAKAIKIPKIVKRSEVEHLGVQLAKHVDELKTESLVIQDEAVKELLFNIQTLALQLLKAAGLRDDPKTETASSEAASS